MSPAVFIAASLFSLFGDRGPSLAVVTTLADRNCGSAVDLNRAIPLEYTGKENDLDVTLDGSAACVATPRGAALYAAFALPQAARPDIITVTSNVFGAAVLPPRILLLDGHGAVKRELAGGDVMFHGNGLSARFRNHSDETYLVVESDPALIGTLVSRVTESTSAYMMPAGNGYFTIHTGSDETSQLLYSHTGKLQITLEPLPKPK